MILIYDICFICLNDFCFSGLSYNLNCVGRDLKQEHTNKSSSIMLCSIFLYSAFNGVSDVSGMRCCTSGVCPKSRSCLEKVSWNSSSVFCSDVRCCGVTSVSISVSLPNKSSLVNSFFNVLACLDIGVALSISPILAKAGMLTVSAVTLQTLTISRCHFFPDFTVVATGQNCIPLPSQGSTIMVLGTEDLLCNIQDNITVCFGATITDKVVIIYPVDVLLIIALTWAQNLSCPQLPGIDSKKLVPKIKSNELSSPNKHNKLLPSLCQVSFISTSTIPKYGNLSPAIVLTSKSSNGSKSTPNLSNTFLLITETWLPVSTKLFISKMTGLLAPQTHVDFFSTSPGCPVGRIGSSSSAAPHSGRPPSRG